MKVTRAYAPASIGNVSLGFDVLGAALKPISGELFGDLIEVNDAAHYQLSVGGKFAHKLPKGEKENIVTLCHDYFNKLLVDSNYQPVNVKLHLRKELPIGSGLGSSASSIVAAFAALNEHAGSIFDEDTLLKMMGELEGQISGSIHYDNVAPSYLGGLTLMTGEPSPIAQTLPIFENWHWVVCYSGISVSTSAARKLLPKHYELKDTLTFGRQLAVFVQSLYSKNETLAANMMHDVIAEEHRKVLLPKFDDARQYCQTVGSLAFGISGSGPTVFAVTDSLETAEKVQRWLENEYIQNGDGFSHICKLDEEGARLLADA